MLTSRFYVNFKQYAQIYIRVLFCTGIDLDDIMQIDCLTYKYLLNIVMILYEQILCLV